MPLPIIPVPLYPNVPFLPGVPSLIRNPGSIINLPVLVNADVQIAINSLSPPIWGIYDSSGQIAIFADSVLEVEYKNDNRVATAPQEQGAFVSYNKVADPFTGRVKLAQGGTIANRTTVLNSCAAAVASLDLYSIIMPEFIYPSVNIVHYDFKRNDHQGVTLLIIDVWFEEIRITGTSTYTNTKTASGQDPKTGGTPQPRATTPISNRNIVNSDSAISGGAGSPIPPGALT